jgi:hypothetical protein
MWDAIRSAQLAHGAAAAGAVPGVRPLHGRRWRLPAVIAAALLLGIALDRIAVQTGESVSGTPSTRVAAVPSGAAAPAPSSSDEQFQRSSGSAQPGVPTNRAANAREDHAAERVASAMVGGRRPSDIAREDARHSDRPALPDSVTSRLYRLAAVQTLAQAEALLTSYRASDIAVRDPVAARQLGSWGREVLSSTRLLIDSPAGSDSRLRPLLNDLELVLVQIVQLSGAPLDASDRALIDRALRDRDLLPRIRSAVPPGAASTSSDEED